MQPVLENLPGDISDGYSDFSALQSALASDESAEGTGDRDRPGCLDFELAAVTADLEALGVTVGESGRRRGAGGQGL